MARGARPRLDWKPWLEQWFSARCGVVECPPGGVKGPSRAEVWEDWAVWVTPHVGSAGLPVTLRAFLKSMGFDVRVTHVRRCGVSGARGVLVLLANSELQG